MSKHASDGGGVIASRLTENTTTALVGVGRCREWGCCCCVGALGGGKAVIRITCVDAFHPMCDRVNRHDACTSAWLEHS